MAVLRATSGSALLGFPRRNASRFSSSATAFVGAGPHSGRPDRSRRRDPLWRSGNDAGMVPPHLFRVDRSFRSPSAPFRFSALPTSLWTALGSAGDDEENTNSGGGGEGAVERLSFLRKELVRLAGGRTDFNANSPAQRSVAIFGEVRSCTKRILGEIANAGGTEESEYGGLSSEKRLLAGYILEFQELSKQQEQLQQQQEQQQHQQHQQQQEQQQQHQQETKARNASISGPEGGRKDGGGRGQPPRKRPPTHEEIVEELFSGPSSRLDPYWREPLLELSRPLARDLARQLDPESCPMGYDPDATPSTSANTRPSAKGVPKRGKRVGFLGYCRDQKELYPQHVILVRCGDFYETFGIDAMLLVEHVGLNPMGGKARSGCPKQNIGQTLQGLTDRGFSVAVYEEIDEAVGGRATTSTTKKLKQRSLAQIVSPASPTYLYDNWLLGSDGAESPQRSLDGLPPPRPCVGIVNTAAGYAYVEISMEERSVQYSERLTSEAVACRLAAYPPSDPLLYVPSPSEKGRSRAPDFLAGTGGSANRGRIRTRVLDPKLVPVPSPGTSDADRYVRAVVDEVLRTNESRVSASTDGPEDKDVALLDRGPAGSFAVTTGSTATNPLYVETATQLGLMDDGTIPPLIGCVLDDAAPAASRRFLKRYLLIPPPPAVARSMASVVGALTNEEKPVSLPPLAVPNLGKALVLIRAGQAGAGVYGELLQSLDTTRYVLDMYNDDETDNFVEALLHMCQHESGIPAERNSLLERCNEAIGAIEAVVSPSFHAGEVLSAAEARDTVSKDEFVPVEFFERNERTWRGRVKQSVAADAYDRVRIAALQLSEAVREDFIGGNESNKGLIKYNYFDNLVSLQKTPTDGSEEYRTYVRPYDRFGKVLSNRWTTERVKEAVSRYVSECDNAANEVASILSGLAKTLQDDGHIPAIVQSSHLNLVLSTAFHHAIKATNSGWQLATTIEDPSSSEAQFVDVFPYWMHESRAVKNTFDLSTMILLTAPNMSGKSTLMRSTAAAALLTVCGLCAPLSSGSRISRFDTLFLRGASSDVPTEDKSAFGAEMGDLAALFRCSGPKSFVFVDELGRGTSPRDGTRLAGAVLESMADRGMSGIFATHLHGVLDLPLKRDRILTKRIKIDRDERTGTVEWTHELEDGFCTDSMALVTAERFGLPEDILRRARELTESVPGMIQGQDNCGAQSTENDRDPRAVLSPSDDQVAGHASPEAVTTDNQWKEFKNQCHQEFRDVVGLASELLVEANVTSVEVPPRHHPPPSLSNRSCLYILQLVPKSRSSITGVRYYVGETDSISKRLSQHRKKGGAWGCSGAFVFPLGNKSQARYYESALIGELARAGYSLESIVDGRTLRHMRD